VATTDPEVAARALDALVQSDIDAVVLHREREIAAGNVVSDVDLVIGCAPHEAIARAWPLLTRAGLHPIVAFPYEVSELTVFICDDVAQGAAQIDLLADSAGTSVFGLRRHALLSRATKGVRWPAADPLDEILYLTRKRQVKNDHRQVEALRARAASFASSAQRARARELFVPSVATAVVNALENGLDSAAYRPEWGYQVRTLRRRLTRVRRPAGFWVELVSSSPEPTTLAGRVACRFGKFLVATGVMARPDGPAELPRFLSDVARVRWRPGVVFSTASRPRFPRADLVVRGDGIDPDDLASQTVVAMERRVRRLVGDDRCRPPLGRWSEAS
jgi:hypothetical protein